MVESVFAGMKSKDASFPYTNIASVPTTHSYNMDEFGEKGIRGEAKMIFGNKRAVSFASTIFQNSQSVLILALLTGHSMERFDNESQM